MQMRNRVVTGGLFILLVLFGQKVLAQEPKKEPFYQQIVRAVVRIEKHQSICVPGLEWAIEQDVTVGTGFFVNDRVVKNGSAARRFFLVTARHLVENQGDLFARVAMNETGDDTAVLVLPRDRWVFHPGPNPPGTFPIDVAVARVERTEFIKAFLHCREEDNPEDCGKSANTDKQRISQLKGPPSVTERTIFFGFPAGDITRRALEPFARAGVVAYTESNPQLRIGGRVSADSQLYLIDAPSFAGNSGGPVLRELLPFMGPIEVRGLVTGGHSRGRDYAIITSVTRIQETVVYARSRANRNRDGWQSNSPTLPIRCTPDQ